MINKIDLALFELIFVFEETLHNILFGYNYVVKIDQARNLNYGVFLFALPFLFRFRC